MVALSHLTQLGAAPCTLDFHPWQAEVEENTHLSTELELLEKKLAALSPQKAAELGVDLNRPRVPAMASLDAAAGTGA